MSHARKLSQTGDTLVEVMLATAVLSLVLAGAFTISNRATRINQTANERTTVSNLMQREAELLKAAQQQDSVAFWDKMKYELEENKEFCKISNGASIGDNAFFMDDSLNKVKVKRNGTKVVDAVELDLYDVWIEAVDSTDPNPQYADFFIFGCWEGIGGQGEQSSGVVLRLAK